MERVPSRILLINYNNIFVRLYICIYLYYFYACKYFWQVDVQVDKILQCKCLSVIFFNHLIFILNVAEEGRRCQLNRISTNLRDLTTLWSSLDRFGIEFWVTIDFCWPSYGSTAISSLPLCHIWSNLDRLRNFVESR